MRVVSWNLGVAFNFRRTHDQAWQYLVELDPDIALLQEVDPPAWTDDRWAVEYSTYRPIERRGIRLALQTISEHDPDHPLVRGARGVPRGLGVEIVLEVDDLDELHGRLTGLGSDVSPLKTQDWGLRDFRVLDPDGYYLRITTPPPRSPGAS